ncbi:SusC/RagA family TonB-linked outer membrane protein [Hymenobacter guriensis]|uniref:TonB-dependent receptor n=1 Tax=Hymenobacter guriensis TaxID=2793065 RepID=A0ABS0KXK4_9BACT|nr:TonB-dependent receptor [Hymenobacter guriensis]MBG8552586.1 TonB-dependent receptor [Hymenobacter guriensis]
MKHKVLLSLVLYLLLGAAAWAQTRSVSGRVTGAGDGAGLPGVTVLERGTTNGTSTDANGAFTLTVQDGASLVFSSIGFVSQTVPVTGSTVAVRLQTNETLLNEAVVVGYGSQAKADLTGAITQVAAKDIQNTPVPTFEQALQGKAAGVFVENTGGKLGQAVKVRIRGTSSVSGNNQPLYVVDGIPIISEDQSTSSAATNPIADLNPNDIESISILKDASATAIYGSRGSNGVMLITTKHGRKGKTNFNLGVQYGTSEPTNYRKFLNAKEYVELVSEAAANENERDPSFDYVAYTNVRLRRWSAGNDDYKTGAVDTDWQKEVLQKNPFSQYDLSASGGDDKTRFYISGGYSDQKGILISNRFQKMTSRMNLEHTATDKLTLGVNLSLARTENHRLDNDNSFGTPMQIVALSPITPVIDPRTQLLSGALDLTTGLPNTLYPVYYNPLLSVENASNETTVYRALGNVFAQYQIVKGLSFRTEEGIDFLDQNEEYYSGRLTARNTDFTSNGNAQSNYSQNVRFTTNNFFSYRYTASEQHSLEAIVGMSYEGRSYRANSVSGQQFPSDSYKSIASAGLINAGSSSESASSLLSYFGRANYAFDSKYLVSLSARVDGSSRFGANNRYGFFPAASIGWVVTEEAFLQDQKVLSFLKPRISYGKTGNQGFGDFSARSLYGAGSYGALPTQRPVQIGNPNLKWELTTQVDAGLEFGFINNRISGEVDVYQKKSDQLALNVNLPGTTGFTRQLQNLGKMDNKGVEFALNTQNLVGNFTWSTNFNASYNKNKVVNLNGQVIEGGYINRAVEGQPIGVFYTVEYAGVDPENGDALYYLNTTNADGSLNRSTTPDYNAAQRVVVGNPNPKWTGGVTNTFGFKGIDLGFTFQGVFGNKVFNGAGQYMSASAGNGYDNQTADQLERWQKPGDITDVPQARLFEGNGVANSTRYLSDASYVRLKQVTLGYNLPTAWTTKVGMQRVRLYFTGVNLLTFTDYEGWDPEVNTDYLAGNIGQGNDFYSTPQAKTYTWGINIGF